MQRSLSQSRLKNETLSLDGDVLLRVVGGGCAAICSYQGQVQPVKIVCRRSNSCRLMGQVDKLLDLFYTLTIADHCKNSMHFSVTMGTC